MDKHVETYETYERRRLWMMFLAIVLSLIVVNGTVLAVVELGIMGRNPDLNKEKRFGEFKNPYEDINKDTVPFVQKWYRSMDLEENTLIPKNTGESVNSDASCISAYLSEIGNRSTSPAYIELVLDNLGLRQSLQVRKILDDYIKEPQSLDEQLNESASCLSNTIGVSELACIMRERSPLDLSDESQNNFFEYVLNLYVVLNALTIALPSDIAALHEITEIMTNARRVEVEDYIIRFYSGSMQKVYLAKVRGLVLCMQRFGNAIATNQHISVAAYLQTNILEAVKLDITIGHDANARVGMAVAARVPFDLVTLDQEPKWGLGKVWIDSYMAWNMAFVASNLPPTLLAKLLIPTVACQSQVNEGEEWMVSRVISLAISLMLLVDSPTEPVDIPNDAIERIKVMHDTHAILEGISTERSATGEALGKSNLQTVQLTSPSRSLVESVLYRLCAGQCHDGSWAITDSVPHAKMSDHQVLVYTAFVVWLTVLLSGLGLELFFWIYYLDTWCEQHEALWRFAQLLFPLLLTTTLGLAIQANYLALPVMVVGLWKFGFPETLMYMYLALFASDESWFQRSADLMNAIGLIVHHGALALFMSLLLVSVIPPSRYVVIGSLVLIMQHWFVLVKYANVPVYVVIELALEFWFEWIVISEFQYYRSIHWTAAWLPATMLVAHWLFLGAGAIELFSQKREGFENNVYIRGNLMRREELQCVLEAQQAASASELGGLMKQVDLCREEAESTRYSESNTTLEGVPGRDASAVDVECAKQGVVSEEDDATETRTVEDLQKQTVVGIAA